jgi:hypothetical protein
LEPSKPQTLDFRTCDGVTTFQRMELEKIEAELAKQRQGTRTDLVKPKVTSVSNETEVSGKAMDVAAKQVGLKPTTYHRAKTVLSQWQFVFVFHLSCNVLRWFFVRL